MKKLPITTRNVSEGLAKRKLGTGEIVPRLHFGLGYSNLPIA